MRRFTTADFRLFAFAFYKAHSAEPATCLVEIQYYRMVNLAIKRTNAISPSRTIARSNRLTAQGQRVRQKGQIATGRQVFVLTVIKVIFDPLYFIRLQDLQSPCCPICRRAEALCRHPQRFMGVIPWSCQDLLQ